MAYVTKQGDTFDSIAFNIYGDRRYTQELMEANPEQLEMVIFSGGVTLNLPEIDNQEASLADVPPWRK